MSGSLYVLVGVFHVQASPDVFSVFLWSEKNIAAPFCWFVSNIFYDIHLLPLVQSIKLSLSGKDILLCFCTAPFASGSTCNFTLTPLNFPKPGNTSLYSSTRSTVTCSFLIPALQARWSGLCLRMVSGTTRPFISHAEPSWCINSF